MIAVALAVALGAAPGCPAALARAGALPDPDLALAADPVLDALLAEGAAGPTEALRAEAARARAAPAPELPAAGARFRAALARHCALASQPALPGDGAAARARAAEILERPVFRRARADPEALRRWLLDRWQRLLELGETGGAQRYAAFGRAVFLLAIGAAALVGLLALRRRRSPGAAAPAPAPEPSAPAADARLDGAAAAAARGEGARAVRLALLAALAALERQGAVPPGRTLTNGELVDELRGADPARLDALRTLSRLFDRTVYGGRPAGDADADAALRAARALGAGETR